MVEKKGALEVEVIRARGLVGKPGSKSLPGNLSHHTTVKTGNYTRCHNPEVNVSTLTHRFCHLFCSQHLM